LSYLPARDRASRAAFLRRGGALGIAGAAALGFPLLDAPQVAPLFPLAKRIFAPTGKAVVRIGHIEGFSGYMADAAYSQSSGMQLAVEEANKRNSRVRFELVKGDDLNDAAAGVSEAQRLVKYERVDVLTGVSSTAVGLKVMRFAERAGVLFLQIGTSGTSITGSDACRVSFRATCNNQMLTQALAPPLLLEGKRWFFLTVDYAFGIDAQARLTRLLLEAGGRVAGCARHANGETNFSSHMRRIAGSDADVLVLCSGGPDVQNAIAAITRAGLHRHVRIGGVQLDNDNVVGMPVDELVGSLWGYVWGPDAGGRRTAEIYGKLKARAVGFPSNWSQYLGYIAGEQLTERILAVGTTDTTCLIEAFENERPFDAGKSNPSRWRRCDHQLVQDTYAARIVPACRRRNAYEFFNIVHTVTGKQASGSCAGRDAQTAAFRMRGPVPERSDYAPIVF
jgi:branched-chain amino acid transport system substrate-binding protein